MHFPQILAPIFFLSLGLFLVSMWMGGRTDFAEWLMKHMWHGYVWNETKERSGIRRVLMWFGIVGLMFMLAGGLGFAEMLR